MDQQTDPRTALLLICFLKEGSRDDQDLQIELASLESRLTPSCKIPVEDEDLQSDGHFYDTPLRYLDGLRPQARLHGRDEIMDEEAVRNVAAGLIEIADQLERTVISQVTTNLLRKLLNCPKECWKICLSSEVEKILHGGLSPSLDQLPKERLLLALTFTLVKGVCKRAPHLLHGLFNTALQYVNNIF